jgi:nucleotide-binding universal stress UspA family protein
MFKSILVAVDGSSYAQAATDYGAYLATEFGSRVELIHVIDWRLLVGHFISHFDEVFRKERGESFTERVKRYYQQYAERIVEQARQRAKEFGVSDIAVTIETGNIAKHIIERAAGSDLVVIGQRGESSEDETGFPGSVTGRVVHSIKTTALIVQPPMRMFRRALVAYDGSAAAHRALQAIVPLAVAFRLELDVVHLIEPRKDPNCLKRASELLAVHPVSYITHYLEGDSHAVILKHAKEKECDLLAMGAFSDRDVEVLALGTTTEAMLGQSHIPVFVHR